MVVTTVIISLLIRFYFFKFAPESILCQILRLFFFLIGRMEIEMMSSLLFLLLGFNSVANSLLDFSSPMKSPFLQGRIIVVANSFQIHVGGSA